MNLFQILIIIFMGNLQVSFSKEINELNLNNEINSDIIQDALLTTPLLISKYGYPSETYIIESHNGYLLEMHRIARPGAQPVLLVHGILDSSSTWIIMGPGSALGYLLYDHGYDVWLANVRGNRYSRKHKSLDPDGNEYWKFSWHEIGVYDLPRMIDYILEKTKYKKLHYIGHSQGSTCFWVMCSSKPQYNDKILSMHALGPVAFTKHCKSPIIKIMTLFLKTLTLITKMIGLNEFMPNTEFLKMASQILCRDGSISQAICTNTIFLITGFNPDQMNTTMLPVMISHAPAGSSSRQIIHFGQLTRSGEFRQYDHGLINNYFNYGTFTPPSYILSNVRAKVALYYAKNDWLADRKDVENLKNRLPNIVHKFIVPHESFNHLDFVWAIDANTLLYGEVIKTMKKIELDLL